MPIATVIDNQIKAVPRAIFAAVQRLGVANLKQNERFRVRGQVRRYYAKMRKKFDDESLTPPFDGKGKNALKAIGITDDTITVANYIVMFGGRDTEGHTLRVDGAGKSELVPNSKVNGDGSRGEFFTQDTILESEFTKNIGKLAVDWEHRQQPDEAGPTDEVLGHVDWKTAIVDNVGVW
ncbi:MAG: hypothetical protein GY869_00550, partial [Planctomycetes bacterium]|nr:hypothetical protein [Planctomycetota bacterium]